MADLGAENEELRDLLAVVARQYDAMLAHSVVRTGRFRPAPEDAAVALLCSEWGHGAVMDRAAYLWQLRDPVGALTTGPTLGVAIETLRRIREALDG